MPLLFRPVAIQLSMSVAVLRASYPHIRGPADSCLSRCDHDNRHYSKVNPLIHSILSLGSGERLLNRCGQIF